MRAALLLLTAVSCNSGSGGVRPWRASDHDPPEKPLASEAAEDGELAPSASPAVRNDSVLADVAWRKRCVECHGENGHGDGPKGPMVRAPDLTRGDWQSTVTDADIALVIRKGRNKMPAFDLPETVINGLVARIRSAKR